MHQMPSGTDRLVVQGDFGAFSPQELFDHFVTPSLLAKWWAPQATIEPGEGGSYKLEWPEVGWVLSGVYGVWLPGARLVMTWKWSHDPGEITERVVDVEFAPAPDGGAMLTITQSPYGNSDVEQKDRQGQVEGWTHFGMKLAGLKEGHVD